MARIDRDQIFHLLKSRRRRLVLDVLDRSNGRMRFRDLVESVASREYDTTRDRLDSTKRKRTYNALYQTHIPAQPMSASWITTADHRAGRSDSANVPRTSCSIFGSTQPNR
ncbi:hypothetical protein ACFFQF_01010 [Haladaptatus pallidirubidus]|uniref:DUF7344 domain-containing protein n=1 Tax=Haladaptatus pallidirubidus TaxID=1008152 RepID=UPI0035EDF6B3